MDIVNEYDEVIGQDTRKHIHDNHEIHRGVHVLVRNSKGDVLVQRRSLSKDYYPGYYDISVGAQVSSGESYEDAARREVAEELGCQVTSLIPVAYYDAFSARQREKRRLYLLCSEGPFEINACEVQEIEFLALTDLVMLFERRPFTEGCKKSIFLYIHYLQSEQADMLDPVRSQAVLDAAGLGEPV